VNEWLGGTDHEELVSLKDPDLKLIERINWIDFGMCWSRHYRLLNSCVVNTRSGPKMYALDENHNIFPLRGASFLVKILYWQCSRNEKLHTQWIRARRTVATHNAWNKQLSGHRL